MDRSSFGWAGRRHDTLGTIAIAVRPAWRRPYGLLVVACTALATVLIPVSTSSGEALEERVGNPGEHAELGDQLIWFAIPMLLLAAALWWLDRRDATAAVGTARASSAGMVRTVAVLAVVAALATTVQVYRVGDSGARAAWGDQVSSGN
jgi:hypothetical protein